MTNPKPISHDNEQVIFADRRGEPVVTGDQADTIEVTQVDADGNPVMSTILVNKDRKTAVKSPFAP